LSEKLDEADREIIRYLRENARMTFVDIGKALDISDATVYNRVKRLTEMGVIKKFTIEVDDAFQFASSHLLVTSHFHKDPGFPLFDLCHPVTNPHMRSTKRSPSIMTTDAYFFLLTGA